MTERDDYRPRDPGLALAVGLAGCAASLGLIVAAAYLAIVVLIEIVRRLS